MRNLSVAAIENGTVIDHLPAGQGLYVIKLLKLASHQNTITLGLNLPSKSMGLKDLIKIEGKETSKEEADQIALFAPKATINVIANGIIIKKFKVALPDHLFNLIDCPNQHCITRFEKIASSLQLVRYGRQKALRCTYCEKEFVHEPH